MQWDIEADMVCTGSGAAGLASAIAGDDLGGDVFVASAPPGEPLHHSADGDIAVPMRTHADRLHPWLDAHVSDLETAEYLAALSSDLDPLTRGVYDDADIPISVVRDMPVEPGLKVAPFYGARLREWAARCLASPYGFLHTRLSDWWTTTLHTIDGETIEVAEIGSITIDSGNAGEALFQWLTVAGPRSGHRHQTELRAATHRVRRRRSSRCGFHHTRGAVGGSSQIRRDGGEQFTRGLHAAASRGVGR